MPLRHEREAADTHAMRVLLLLLITGCAGTHLVWRTTEPRDFKADWYACELDARVTSQHRRGGATVHVDEELRERCMRSKGWEQFEEADQVR